MYEFSEVMDLTLKTEKHFGDNKADWQKDGEESREFFVLYKGPPISKNKKKFLEELAEFMDRD